MTHLYSIEGTGRLRAAGKDLGEVEYEISVFRPGTLKEIIGTIYADWRKLHEAFDSRKATLVLEGGKEVEVLILSVTMGVDSAPIHVNGDIQEP